MGAQRSVHDDVPKGGDAAGESRIVQLAGGMRWRATVVARLISEDIAAGHERARLVLRLECLSARRRALRASVAGISSLAALDDEALGALVQKGRSSGIGHRSTRLPTKGR